MKKIDDLKLQMYVDNELSKEESTEVENLKNVARRVTGYTLRLVRVSE